ncbi:methyltransferase domain-containing protein, partial [Candidatus Margulisiibacteriota bacterium]
NKKSKEILPYILKQNAVLEEIIFILYFIENITNEDPITNFIKLSKLLYTNNKILKNKENIQNILSEYNNLIKFLQLKLDINNMHNTSKDIKNKIKRKFKTVNDSVLHWLPSNINTSITFNEALIEVSYLPLWEIVFNIKVTTNSFRMPKQNLGIFNDGYYYEPLEPLYIGQILKYATFNENDIIYDLGCGAGFPSFCFATQKVKEVKGIDIQKEIIAKAQSNYKNIKNHPLIKSPITFILGDVGEEKIDISDGTVYFLFNPFLGKTFSSLLHQIEESLQHKNNPRRIRLIYLHPMCKKEIEQADWLKFINNPEEGPIYIWENDPAILGR